MIRITKKYGYELKKKFYKFFSHLESTEMYAKKYMEKYWNLFQFFLTKCFFSFQKLLKHIVAFYFKTFWWKEKT